MYGAVVFIIIINEFASVAVSSEVIYDADNAVMYDAWLERRSHGSKYESGLR